MRRDLRRTALGLACVGLLLAAAPAFAQQRQSAFGTSGSFNSTSIIGGGSSFGSGGSGGSAFGGSSSFGGNMGGGSAFGGNMGGGSAFGGNSAFGGTSGTTTGRGGSTQVGATSFLGSSYANPLAMGLSGGSGTTTTNTAFGNAMYNLNTNRSGTATVSSSSGLQNSQFGAGYNIRRLPAYAATIKIKDLPPPPSAAQVQNDLQTMFARSSDLDRRDSVRVVMDGPVVVLQGQVADDDERRLVENMVRLTPGVHDVRNEVTMMTTTTARRGP